MRILIASALFPPDIADPAPYIKELAARLSNNHEVMVLTYGSIPETIENVTIHTIPKYLLTAVRLLLFTRALFTGSRKADRVLIQNAPSTELPLMIVGLFYRSKLLLQESDQKIVYTGWRKILHKLASHRVMKIVDIGVPLPRPEILPFSDLPADAFSKYETSWDNHLRILNTYLL